MQKQYPEVHSLEESLAILKKCELDLNLIPKEKKKAIHLSLIEARVFLLGN
ncbi:hypothetical protein SHL58_001782 [Campylobacter coli]|nr:hypothetical protein [Campylobacter coli]ELV6617218.1 hypothetical protein [Campylobacter coli]